MSRAPRPLLPHPSAIASASSSTRPSPKSGLSSGITLAFPSTRGGIAAVELEDDPRARVCQFRPPDGNGLGPRLREYVRWESENVGYASSAEPDNRFGLSDTLSLVTVLAGSKGTMFTWEEYYVASDLAAARASFEDGLADMAQRLVARFGGRIVEHFTDGGR